MRLWRPPPGFLNKTVGLNVALGVAALTGAVLAYDLVTGPPDMAAAATGTARTVAVSQGSVVATVSASGAVESATTAAADFATSGTVTSISVKIGDTVTKGQVLAQVDPTDAQAQLDTARANLYAANASLDRAEDSGDDASVATAKAQVTTADAAVDDAERAVAGTTLKAPMAGTVTAVNGSVGGSASGTSSSSSGSGQGGGSTTTGFIQLADLTTMQVSASFAEADATKLKTAQTATITWAALTGATATGKVATIAPTANTSNNVNSYAVTVSLDTLPEGVRIGQTVRVAVTVAQADNAIRVPTAAVRTTGTRRTVSVVTNGVTELRAVEVGVEGDSFVEITTGLAVGEQVAIVVDASSTTTNNGNFPGGGTFPGGGGLPGGGAGGGLPGGGGAGGGGAR